LIPLSTLQAGYRLLLHGLAAERLHATSFSSSASNGQPLRSPIELPGTVKQTPKFATDYAPSKIAADMDLACWRLRTSCATRF